MSCTEKKKCAVIKIGSSTLTASDSSIDTVYLDSLIDQVHQLRMRGWSVVLVSSGAIACGLGVLGMDHRPEDMPTLQAAASVGQSTLAAEYAQSFSRYDMMTSLVLLTRRDTADRNAYLHARDTLTRLLELEVTPIVNENDTVSVEQIRFGDNDTLATLVACLVNAQILIILSDIDGLYDKDPHTNPAASLVRHVDRIDKQILKSAGGAGSAAGSGGMQTKVQAARVMLAAGIPMAVVHGKHKDVIVDTVFGACPGTMFSSAEHHHEMTPRKLWLALGDASKGSLTIDDGAKKALEDRGSSLLSVGIDQVDGRFEAGDVVDILDTEGIMIGRGKSSFSSDEVSLTLGMTRLELKANRLLAPLSNKPVVHRDDLVMLD